MPFELTKSIDIDFAHHVHGHPGACINIHGHTWKFEVTLAAAALDERGFVIDFKELKQNVLQPCHDLLDHSLALKAETFDWILDDLARLGTMLHMTRKDTGNEHLINECTPGLASGFLNEARQRYIGGMKCVAFPFTPTSERIAKWLYEIANEAVVKSTNGRVRCMRASIYETLHPVQAIASYTQTQPV